MSARGTERTAALRVIVACSFQQRLKGWMGRRQFPADEALLLRPCSSVHGLFMRQPIDVVFLDRQCQVLRAAPLRPWRALRCPGAHMALELAHGAFPRWGQEAVQRAVLAATASSRPARCLAREER